MPWQRTLLSPEMRGGMQWDAMGSSRLVMNRAPLYPLSAYLVGILNPLLPRRSTLIALGTSEIRLHLPLGGIELM